VKIFQAGPRVPESLFLFFPLVAPGKVRENISGRTQNHRIFVFIFPPSSSQKSPWKYFRLDPESQNLCFYFSP